MSYRIEFSDGTTVDVESERGEKIKELKLHSRPSQTIELNGNVLELSRIRSVRRISDARTSGPPPIDPSRCRGFYSIQIEISKLIRAKYGTDWPKHMQDKEARERIRVYLHQTQPDRKWCDLKEGTCSCFDEPVIDKADPLYEWRTLFGDVKPFSIDKAES